MNNLNNDRIISKLFDFPNYPCLGSCAGVTVMPHFSPTRACLWGSYSLERISVRPPREGGCPSPRTGSPKGLGARILVPRSWYQDLPRSQVKHPGPRNQNSDVLKLKQEVLLKVRPQNILSIRLYIIFRGAQLSEK